MASWWSWSSTGLEDADAETAGASTQSQTGRPEDQEAEAAGTEEATDAKDTTMRPPVSIRDSPPTDNMPSDAD